MNKNLKIASFDLETTGVDTNKDRIVQLAICYFQISTQKKEMFVIGKYEFLINPGIPIPAGASEVHGITDEMVKDCPSFEEIVEYIKQTFQDADCLSGYNIGSFDVPLLLNEFDRVGVEMNFTDKVILDTFKINNHFNPRTLSNVYRNYTQKELQNAHDAMVDVDGSNEVLMCQIEQHELDFENPKEIELLVNNGKPRVDFAQKFTINEDGEYAFNFGKNQGKSVLFDTGYLHWMLKQDFPNDTKNWIKKFLDESH